VCFAGAGRAGCAGRASTAAVSVANASRRASKVRGASCGRSACGGGATGAAGPAAATASGTRRGESTDDGVRGGGLDSALVVAVRTTIAGRAAVTTRPAPVGAAASTGGAAAGAGAGADAGGDASVAAGAAVAGVRVTTAGAGASVAGVDAAVAGAGAGAWGGATGGGALARAGSSASGSRYPCSCAAVRTPRCTYACGCSESPLGPAVPTTAPSATVAPTVTAVEPRCVSVTARPPAVVIVSDRPDDGTLPANVTLPEAGASTALPVAAATSMPRCCPGPYGCAGSKTKCWSTGPLAGHVQAPATGTQTSAATIAPRRTRRIGTTLLSVWRTFLHGAGHGLRCQTRLQSCHSVAR
jgi:hypothetical protein